MTGDRYDRDSGDDEPGEVDPDGTDLDEPAEPATGLRTAQERSASEASIGASNGAETAAATDESSASSKSDTDGLDELAEPSRVLRSAQEREPDTSTNNDDDGIGGAGDRDA